MLPDSSPAFSTVCNKAGEESGNEASAPAHKGLRHLPPPTHAHTHHLTQTERDTIEVIAFLKREDTRKDEELSDLRHQVSYKTSAVVVSL